MPINLPEYDLSLFTIPKCGGTTIWEWCYYIRTGESFSKSEKDGIYSQGWMRGGPLKKKLIVVRDPVDRFVSGYRNFRDKRGLNLDFDEFVKKFHWLYSTKDNYHHHFRPQSSCVQHPLDHFDHVFHFSEYKMVRKFLESRTRMKLPNYHHQKSRHERPEISQGHLRYIKSFYQQDYDAGFC